MVKHYKQNRIFQNNERKFYHWVGENERGHTNDRMQRNQNNLGVNYRNRKAKWIDNTEKN